MLRRKRPFRVIFEGQSMNLMPTDEGNILGHGYPWHLMRGLGLPYNIVAINGTPFNQPGWTAPGTGHTDLFSTLETRLFPLIGRDEKTIVIMNGGTNDVNSGDSGEKVYQDHVTHAEAIRDAGADYVLTTTVGPARMFTGTKETARKLANSMLVANIHGAFDRVGNLDATPLDPYPEPNPHYFDGLHWYDPGAIICADVVRPLLLSVMNE